METKARRSPRAVATEAPSVATGHAVPADNPESAPVAALPAPVSAPAIDSGDALTALIESQAAMARGLTALGAEIADLARGGIDAATKSAGDLLSARTWADAVEINAGLARRQFEAFVDGSARLSQIGTKLAAEVSAPFVAQLSRDWTRQAR